MHSNSSEKDSLSVLPVKVAEAFEQYPEMRELAEQYSAEAGAHELGGFNLQLGRYSELEGAGVGQGFLLLEGEAVRGFLFMLVYPVPHHAKPIAVIESIFAVCGGGMLVARAKAHAKERGAAALHVTAPAGGRLARRMAVDRTARKASEVFIWAL